MDWGGWKRYALVAGAVAAALTVFGLIYGWLPWWIDGARLRGLSPKDQSGILGSDRGDVLKMVAGAGALVALVYTARKHALDRAGQVTDRYAKAIALLASERESERIGAIYALERIMADSGRDHPTVVEVLAAFVRERAPLGGGDTVRTRHKGKSMRTERMRPRVSSQVAPSRPSPDVQAAMTVLARRPQRAEPFALDLRRTLLAGLELPPEARLARANLTGTDLTGAYLYGATLTEANLARATLTKACLEEATLTGAYLAQATLTDAYLARATLTRAFCQSATLEGAVLEGADLTEADFVGATLTGAILVEATLTETILNLATLTEADFTEATMVKTCLDGAMLMSVRNLEPSQLAGARVTSETVLDYNLAPHPWVQARIKACEGDGPFKMVSVSTPARTPDPGESHQVSGS